MNGSLSCVSPCGLSCTPLCSYQVLSDLVGQRHSEYTQHVWGRASLPALFRHIYVLQEWQRLVVC